ncbi:DUF732 domain-containing protein [Skermania sp. ID1734]|uniref:DUF732 domain-containing protein n=1 Tax=Skermania sp. ID1734 TaxID=2597516 RepID=UPI00117C4B2B|nr:DUF732 domain-containing protein [Skermania sp. ID1734]TSE00359.1 DUF732 domain-containing protein [Skermania sp. ID1734]
MTAHRFATVVRASVLSAAIGASIFAAAGMANADPTYNTDQNVSADQTDQAFVADLQEHGIQITDTQATAHNINLMCQELGQGTSAVSIVEQFNEANPGLTTDQAAYFVVAAVHTYCPENASALQS